MNRKESKWGRHRFFCSLLSLIMLASAFTPVAGAGGIARSYQVALSEWKHWAVDHAYAMSKIQPEQWSSSGGWIEQGKFSDLDMLIPLLADKRIVYLGENSHGVAEFSLVKTRMIQYLHQTLGYNIVAFESGLGDAALAQGDRKSVV